MLFVVVFLVTIRRIFRIKLTQLLYRILVSGYVAAPLIIVNYLLMNWFDATLYGDLAQVTIGLSISGVIWGISLKLFNHPLYWELDRFVKKSIKVIGFS